MPSLGYSPSIFRWEHHCPGCNKLLHIRRIYCNQCISAHSDWAKFTLKIQQRWLRGQRLSGIPYTKARYILSPSMHCIECGEIVKGKLNHQCHNISKQSHYCFQGVVWCAVCYKLKWVTTLPILEPDIRCKICFQCLSAGFIVEVESKKLPNKERLDELKHAENIISIP